MKKHHQLGNQKNRPAYRTAARVRFKKSVDRYKLKLDQARPPGPRGRQNKKLG